MDIFRNNGAILDNICYLLGDCYIEGPDQRVQDLTGLPSPYLMGLFDSFFDYPLIPLIETTRGCPYSCTYCNDGHKFRKKIFRKDSGFIHEELKYIGSRVKKTSQLMISDLNFGMYEEDISTGRTIRSIIKEYNWPNKIQVAFGKRHPGRLIEVAKIINEGNAGILRLGASFQSTDPDVLRNIKRTNLPLEQLLLLKDYKNRKANDNLEFFTEIILALPGDNIDKHYKSLKDVIDLLSMNKIDIHQLTLLEGSELAIPEKRQEFKFDVRYRVFVGCLGIYNIGNKDIPCAEIEEIIVGNSTLSFDDYIECRIMDLLVKIYIDTARVITLPSKPKR